VKEVKNGANTKKNKILRKIPITNREKQGNAKKYKGMRKRKRNIRERQTDKL
jgi:hypothetical protein